MERIFVLGLPDSKKKFVLEKDFEPEFLDIYPDNFEEFPKNLQGIYKVELLIIQWVFPYKFELKKEVNEEFYTHHFVMTDENCSKIYSSALIYHESFQNYGFIPKAIVCMSRHNLLGFHKQFLNKISCILSDSLERVRVPKRYFDQFELLISHHGEAKAERLWDKDFTEIYSHSFKMNKENHEINGKSLIEFYISLVFTELCVPNEASRINIRDIEGNNTFSYVHGKNQGNFYSDIEGLLLLTRKLSSDSILKIIECILQEKQIIFISDNTETLVLSIESLMELIRPL